MLVLQGQVGRLEVVSNDGGDSTNNDGATKYCDGRHSGCRWERATRGAHYPSPHNTLSGHPRASRKFKRDKWAIQLPTSSHISPSRSRYSVNGKFVERHRLYPS
jgi:hypothetical protein